MAKDIHKHLDKTIEQANAAGMHYGAYVAQQTHPVVVVVPKHLKDAPTMFERLAGAVPPPAPEYEHLPPVMPRVAEVKRDIPDPPQCPVYNSSDMHGEGKMIAAPWMQGKRLTARLSQGALARMIGVRRATYYKWEKAQQLPQVLAGYVSELLDYHINYRPEVPKDDDNN